MTVNQPTVIIVLYDPPVYASVMGVRSHFSGTPGTPAARMDNFIRMLGNEHTAAAIDEKSLEATNTTKSMKKDDNGWAGWVGNIRTGVLLSVLRWVDG